MNKIEIKSEKFQNALKRAIAKKTLVKPLPFHAGSTTIAYLVRGSNGDFYPVRFQRASGDAMLGSCLCKAGTSEMVCYHLAIALFVHSGFVACGLRPNAPFRSEISANAAQTFRALPPKLDYRGDESVRNLI